MKTISDADQREITTFSDLGKVYEVPLHNPSAKGTAVSIRLFDDGSYLTHFDSGELILEWGLSDDEPCEDPAPVPKAYLYYWRVICECPDVNTWSDIEEAERQQGAVGGVVI
jgi:hypothetical protein